MSICSSSIAIPQPNSACNKNSQKEIQCCSSHPHKSEFIETLALYIGKKWPYNRAKKLFLWFMHGFCYLIKKKVLKWLFMRSFSFSYCNKVLESWWPHVFRQKFFSSWSSFIFKSEAHRADQGLIRNYKITFQHKNISMLSIVYLTFETIC